MMQTQCQVGIHLRMELARGLCQRMPRARLHARTDSHSRRFASLATRTRADFDQLLAVVHPTVVNRARPA